MPWLLWSLSSLASPLDEALAHTPSLGLSSAHCPGKVPSLGTHGVEWQALGFSPAGAFASLAYQHDDVVPGWIFTIQSLVDDRTLATVTWKDPEGEKPSREAFLARERAQIDAALQAHGIVVAPQPAPSPFPLQLPDGDALHVSQEQGPQDDYPHVPIRTWLHSQRHGKKRVDARTAADSAVVGYLRSPFEERVALLLVVWEPAFEGTVNCRIRAVGAHLSTGW
jgi:hypothetical protein